MQRLERILICLKPQRGQKSATYKQRVVVERRLDDKKTLHMPDKNRDVYLTHDYTEKEQDLTVSRTDTKYSSIGAAAVFNTVKRLSL
jgi:hypothetical protein